MSEAPEYSKSMILKVDKLIELGLIEYRGEGVWFTYPIPNYNRSSQPHRVRSGGNFGFSCDCQGYQMKLKKYMNLSSSIYPTCSHIGAVKRFEQLKRQKERLSLNQQQFAFSGGV